MTGERKREILERLYTGGNVVVQSPGRADEFPDDVLVISVDEARELAAARLVWWAGGFQVGTSAQGRDAWRRMRQ